MGKGIGAVQAAVMLLAGIFVGQQYHPPALLIFILLASGLAGGCYFYLKGRPFKLDQLPKRFSRTFFCIALLALGMARTEVTGRERPPGSIEKFAGRDPVVFTGHIISPPVTTSSRTTLRVAVDPDPMMPDMPDRGKVLLVFYRARENEFHYGDILRIRGSVILPPDTGSNFSYRAYLERDGVTAMINNPSVEILPGFEGIRSLSAVYRLREVLSDRVFRLFPKPENALMAGILLGDESKISSTVDHAFQKTGTAHIIAISGANFVLLTYLLLGILRKLIRQWWAPLLMVPFIIFYTILVGGNSAVVRAAVMCGLSVVGMAFGRGGSGINKLALTAAGMALVKPSLIYDLGFQLSAAATLGILLFDEPLCNGTRWLLSKIFPKISEGALTTAVSIVNELCLMSVSAQIFTVWISAKAFGRIPLISLSANLLIAPFQSLIMIGGFAALLLSFIFYPPGAAAAWLVWPAPALTIRIVERCAEVKWASIYSGLTPFQAWLIIGLILAFYAGRNNMIRSIRARNYRPYAVMLLLFAAAMIWVNVFDCLDRRTSVRFSHTGSSLLLTIRSSSGQIFIIGDGLSNFAAQEALEQQILPVRKIPRAAWIDTSESWMGQELLDSGAADGLSLFYLNGIRHRLFSGAPEKLFPGFSFAADGVRLSAAASYLGKRAWIVDNGEVRVLFPNGIPPERIMDHGNDISVSDIDTVVIGKRDDAETWSGFSAAHGGFPAVIDRTEEGESIIHLSAGSVR